MGYRKLASFDIPTRDNIHQYQCNNPILSSIQVFVIAVLLYHIMIPPTEKDCANAQADLNLRWAHMSEGTFSDVAAHKLVTPLSYYIYMYNRSKF